MVSYFAKNSGPDHFSNVHQILRYLASGQERGIIFGGEPDFHLIGYSDSNWAEDHADEKSTLGFVFILKRSLLIMVPEGSSCSLIINRS